MACVVLFVLSRSHLGAKGLIAAGVATGGFGLLALAGWAFGRTDLASIGPEWIPMAPSTAVLFVLNGLVLGLRADPSDQRKQRASLVPSVLGGIVALVLLTLGIFDIHVPAELIGFGSIGEVHGAPTGHMSPVTAACFLAASLSSLASGRKSRDPRQRVVAAASAAVLLGTSGVFLLAYLYGNPLLYGSSFIPPALTTVFAFAILGAALLGLALRSEREDRINRPVQDRDPTALFVTFIFLVSGLVTTGHYFYRSQERRHRELVEQQLSAISELKVRELHAWRKERRSDAAVLLGNDELASAVRDAIHNAQDRRLTAWLEGIAKGSEYDRVFFVSSEGDEIASPPLGEPLGSHLLNRVQDVLRSGKPDLVDFYRDGPQRPVFLATLVPLIDRADGNRLLGVLVLRTNPTTWLYPFVQRWPGSSHTAETLLVRRDGDHALFLNELRFRTGSALEIRSSLTDARMPAVRGVLGFEGIVDGIDYRGVPVLASVRSVPDSPWILVARIDAAEVNAPLGERLWETVIVTGLLLIATGLVLGLIMRQRDIEAERRYRRALDGMMEGAQLISNDWRYLYLNEAAVKFGRREASEMLGRRLMEVYPEIETTPLFKALRQTMEARTPCQAEFAFRFPDGEERWFELNAQPVPEGIFVLSLDVTERRLALESLRQKEVRILHLNAVLRGIRNVNQLITRERDPGVLIFGACELMVEAKGVETCSIVVCDHDAVTHYADAGPEDRLGLLRGILARRRLPKCVLHILEHDDDIMVHRNPLVDCPECPVAPHVDGECLAVRLENDGRRFGAMLVSLPVGTESDAEDLDLMREIAGDVAFALGGIERDRERNAALVEIESLAMFLRESPYPMLRFAQDGVILLANPGSEPLLEHWQASVGGVPPEDVRRLADEALQSGKRRDLVLECGGERRFALTLTPIVSAGYVNAYGLDVTARIEAEIHALRLNTLLLRLTRVVQELSQARSVQAIADIVRHASRDLAGSDGATFVLREGDFCHYVDEDAIEPLWKGRRFPMSDWVIRHREPALIEDVYADSRIPTDAYRPTFVRSLVMVPIRTENPIGAIGCYWATVHSATPEELRILQALADSTSVAMENVRAYETLEESEARTRAVYQNLPTATFVWRRTGDSFVLADFNEAARTATRGRVAKFVGKPPSELAFPHLVEDLGRCMVEREPIRREIDFRPTETDANRRFEVTYGFVPPSMVILHARDVTEQRQVEEQLRVAQRMEAVGRLAGGIAHDFNNLLTIILNYTSLAIEEMGPESNLHADLTEIHRAGERAAELTRQLLAFSRKQVLQPKVVNLNDVAAGMESMLRRLIGEDIDLVVALDPDLGNTTVDPGQVEQVVLNLAVNSRDAMPAGGRLTIETSNAELDAEYVAGHPTVEPGSYVMLAVSDDGCGMSAEIVARVFEPFFTTKEQGKGTGLGLATVYGIVNQSGGHIRVYSEVGEGTTFKIYLPRQRSAEESRESRPSARTVAPGAETILLVEDDDGVRKLAARMLRSAGYSVLVAADGAEAIAICKSHAGPIHLLLTDVVMPRMSGRVLVDEVMGILPSLAVLYMSGYTDDAIVHHRVLEAGTQFIGKPFNAGDLLRKVREVLDEHSSA